jgi:hypothetical protein
LTAADEARIGALVKTAVIMHDECLARHRVPPTDQESRSIRP